MSANNRKLTANEIAAVGAILKDKESLALLKQINDSLVTEEETKKEGKRSKQQDSLAFVGFAHSDDILGGDPESEEYKTKENAIKKLVDTGLIVEGFHVPLEQKNEKDFGDLRIPSSKKIGKFKLTEEGITLLSVSSPEGAKSVGQAQQQQQKQSSQQQQQSVKSAAPEKKITEEAVKEVSAANKKEKAINSFKQDIKKENKL